MRGGHSQAEREGGGGGIIRSVHPGKDHTTCNRGWGAACRAEGRHCAKAPSSPIATRAMRILGGCAGWPLRRTYNSAGTSGPPTEWFPSLTGTGGLSADPSITRGPVLPASERPPKGTGLFELSPPEDCQGPLKTMGAPGHRCPGGVGATMKGGAGDVPHTTWLVSSTAHNGTQCTYGAAGAGRARGFGDPFPDVNESRGLGWVSV